MGLQSSRIHEEQLKPGDHIYTWRRRYSYSHHGIYVGEENDQEVIHLTRAPGSPISSSSPSDGAGEDPVVRCSVKTFLCGGDLNRYEYGVRPARFLVKRGGTCSRDPSDPPEDVLHRASILREKGFGDYDLFQSNCEDFAIYCKTGLLKVDMSMPGKSEQIKFLGAALFAVINTPYQFLPATFACLALVVFGLYCAFRLAGDSGVEKVEVEKIVDLSCQRGSGSRTVLRTQSGSSTRWFLTAGEYKVYALKALIYWYWTPTSRILLWLRLLALLAYSYNFVTKHLRDHASKLKLREDVACIIWLLGFWYWGLSDGIIFLWTKLSFLYGFLLFCISDRERGSKLEDYIARTEVLLVYWYWTPKSRILSWTKLAFCFSCFFSFVLPPRSKTGCFFFACFVIQSAVDFLGLDFRDYFRGFAESIFL